MKIIRIMPIVLILITLTACGSKDNRLYFTQYGNGSRGAYWKYEISSDSILREADYYEKKDS